MRTVGTCVHLLLLFTCGFVIPRVDCQSTDLFIAVNPETNMLVDSLGRERFFHGTNVVVKHKPFHPELHGYSKDSFSEIDMKILQSLGLNTIRLGMVVVILCFVVARLACYSLFFKPRSRRRAGKGISVID